MNKLMDQLLGRVSLPGGEPSALHPMDVNYLFAMETQLTDVAASLRPMVVLWASWNAGHCLQKYDGAIRLPRIGR